MMRPVINCGYVPLVDSAPLIIARELGFAAHEGIELNLLRQPSWSALRDLLLLGHLDGAHMLSPMPMAMSLGLSGPAAEVIAPIVLSTNGTVLGVSRALAAEMRGLGWQPNSAAPEEFLAALTGLGRPVRVGVPFPYSMHRLLFEYLIAGAGAEFRQRVQIVTTPPPLMANAVAEDDLDLFAVGEPWGTVAVNAGVAELVLPGSSIWAHAPEKVLGMRKDWAKANAMEARALVRACYRACQWLGKRSNRTLASEILARSEHLDLPDYAIDPALTGQILPHPGAHPWEQRNFLKFFSGATTFPWRSFGAWVGGQLAGLEGIEPAMAVRVGAEAMRPDLHRTYLDGLSVDLPGASAKVEGTMKHATAVASTRGQMILGPDAFFDGKTFDFSENF